jgi:hypothetical protein
MNKIALAFVTATSLLSAPLLATTPANAQIGVEVGPQDRDHGDRDHRDRDRDRGHRGIGIVIGEARHCHVVTVTERHHDHEVIRRERRCD